MKKGRTTPKFSTKGGFASIILIIALLFVAGLGGAYYFGFDHGFEKSIKEQKATATPTSTPTSDETASWKTYKGETAYTSGGSPMFTIKYPSEWELRGNKLYPEGFREDTGFTPYIVLGAGGHGAPPPTGEKMFPAGKATYWRIEEGDKELSLIASFSVGNMSYIFEGSSLQQADEEVFLKMLETLKIAN